MGTEMGNMKSERIDSASEEDMIAMNHVEKEDSLK